MVVFVLVLVGVWIFSAATNPGGSSDFNQYANYILHGEKKSTAITEEYDSYIYYSLDSVLESGTKEEKQAFLATARTLFEPLAAESEVNYSTHLEFLEKHVELGDIEPKTLLTKYQEVGFTSASEYIDNFYAPYNDLAYYNAKKFATAKTTELKIRLGAFVILLEYFDADSIISSDIEPKSISSDDLTILQQKDSEVRENSELAESIVEKAIGEIIRGCFNEN